MQGKWRKFAEKVVRRPPNLDVRTVGHGNVSLKIVDQSKQKK